MKPTSAPFLLAAAVALASLGAQAGPSQASITPPGGFAAACASDISSGVTYTPGLDLVSAFSGWTGRHACQSQVFAGPAGQAAAAATWTAAGVPTNNSAAQAGMGQIHLRAATTARNNIQFPVATAGGGWSDTLVVDLAGHSGEAAVWLFKVSAEGSLSAGGGSASFWLNAYKNEQELRSGVSGYNRGGSDAIGTDRQRLRWGVSRTGSRTIDDEVTFAVPITLGQSFVWGVYGTASAGIAAWGPAGPGTLVTGEVDFSHTARYAGSAGVLLGGVLYDDAQLLAASGIDWRQATPVPEPAAGILMLLGLAALGGLAARRARPSV